MSKTVGGAHPTRLRSDPGEMKNLADQPAMAGELERHRQLLAACKKTTEEEKYPVTASPKPKAKAKAKAARRKAKV